MYQVENSGKRFENPRFSCACPSGFIGDRCEILTTVSMSDDSYLEFESPDLESHFNLTFEVKTDSEDGILFYHGANSKKHLSVELFKGRIRVSFDMGDKIVSTMYSYTKINDGKIEFLKILKMDFKDFLEFLRPEEKNRGKYRRKEC